MKSILFIVVGILCLCATFTDAQPAQAVTRRVLQHIVPFKLENYSRRDIVKLKIQTARMARKIDGIVYASFDKMETALWDGYEDKTKGWNFNLVIMLEDAESLKNYGPHPEHERFKVLIGPFLSDIMRLDSFTDSFTTFPRYRKRRRVLQHLIPFNLKEYEEADIQALKDQTAVMAETIPGIIYASFDKTETELWDGYEERRLGFDFNLVVMFENAQSLQNYAPHPEHQKFVQLVVPLLEDVLDLDSWTRRYPR